MPVDQNVDRRPTTIFPRRIPTYDSSVNSNANVNSDGLNEADEMNLYTPNPLLDSPFGRATSNGSTASKTSTARR